MTKKAFGWLFLLFFIAAAFFRFYELELRPMHHDEANQALKFGLLLEKGEYRYDKTDHHGPSLYYLTWPLARLLGGKTLASQSEQTIRSVPAFFGLGTLLLFLLFLPLASRPVVFWSAAGLALSPAMVYFSRFYIQETLLVFFSVGFLASFLRYLRRPSSWWALSLGFFSGMMYVTKETSVILFAAAAVSFFLTVLGQKKTDRKGEIIRKSSTKENMPRRKPHHLALTVGVALFVVVVLFSSFFQNPRGVLDSFLSFKIYFVRASEASFHIQPWPYYLRLLSFSKSRGAPLWSEGFLLILALIGSMACFRPKSHFLADRFFLRFIFFYTLVTAAIFSFIRYKTPWNLLPFYVGIILLAGVGAASILMATKRKASRAVVLFFLVAGFLHLGWQSYQGNFVFPSNPRNPYVYAQTSPAYLKLVERIEKIASVHPDREKTLIHVVAGPYETWPLPWSLRKFERVGYWQEATEVPLSDRPALVIASAEEAIALEASLNTQYQSEYYELRPNVLLVLFVRFDIWEEYLRGHPGD